jgi:hypothetical protein
VTILATGYELGCGLARAVKASLRMTIFYNDVAAHDPTQFTEALHHKFGNRASTCH